MSRIFFQCKDDLSQKIHTTLSSMYMNYAHGLKIKKGQKASCTNKVILRRFILLFWKWSRFGIQLHLSPRRNLSFAS